MLGHNALRLIYPKGKSLAKGTKWTIPAKFNDGVELHCEVAGFAEVADRKTVKIVSASQWCSNDLVQLVTAQLQAEKGTSIPTGGEIRKAIDTGRVSSRRKMEKKEEILARSIKAIVQEKRTQTLELSCYFDLITGLPVCCQTTYTTHCPKKPEKDQTDIRISQIFIG